MTVWDHLSPDELRRVMDFQPSEHRNLIDLQRVTAIKMIDRQIARDWRDGYGAGGRAGCTTAARS